MTDDRVIPIGLTGLVLLIQLVRWFTERDVVTKKDIEAQQKQIDGISEELSTKAEAVAAISEAELLKRLEKDRHELRAEITMQVGKCVSMDRYRAERQDVEKQLDRLNRRVFNGGSGVSV